MFSRRGDSKRLVREDARVNGGPSYLPGCRVLLVVVVVDEPGDAHVCSGDASLAALFQHFSHVLELPLFVAGTGCDPVVKDAQQRVDVLAQFGNLLELLFVQGVPEPCPGVLDALPGLAAMPQPGQCCHEEGSDDREQQISGTAVHHANRLDFLTVLMVACRSRTAGPLVASCVLAFRRWRAAALSQPPQRGQSPRRPLACPSGYPHSTAPPKTDFTSMPILGTAP